MIEMNIVFIMVIFLFGSMIPLAIIGLLTLRRWSRDDFKKKTVEENNSVIKKTA